MLEVEVLDRHQMITNYMEIARQSVPMLPLERRTGMTEVEIGFDEQTAIAGSPALPALLDQYSF